MKQNFEFILCAAIWVDTGKAEPPRRSYGYPETGLLFTGWRHADCFTTLNAWAELLPTEQREVLAEQIAGRFQGFLTSKGRFVNRETAAYIACRNSQIKERKTTLFSEDLY